MARVDAPLGTFVVEDGRWIGDPTQVAAWLNRQDLGATDVRRALEAAAILGGTAHDFPPHDDVQPEGFEALGGPGSGNWGHQGGVGGPGNPGGSTSRTSTKASWYREGGDWNISPEGDRPYGWGPVPADYQPPDKVLHKVVSDRGLWGYSHGNSQAMTAASAGKMGIEGYKAINELAPQADEAVDRFLDAIANDPHGSQELLYHSFENVRGTEFASGDTLRLPLTATTGGQDNTRYGTRLEQGDQRGQPTIFVFEKGTQMAGYQRWDASDAKDMGVKGEREVFKEFGHVWGEALVAGGFEVVSAKDAYMGSQHTTPQGGIAQIYGKVVTLRQRETFDLKTGWKPRD